MAWPTRKSSEGQSGDPIKEFGQDCWDRDQCLKALCGLLYISSTSTTGTTEATVTTVKVRLPNFARSGDKLRLAMLVSTTSGTASYRVQDNATSTNGNVVTTSSTTRTGLESYLTIPDNTWAGTVRTLNIRLWTTSGTATVTSSYMLQNLRIGD